MKDILRSFRLSFLALLATAGATPRGGDASAARPATGAIRRSSASCAAATTAARSTTPATAPPASARARGATRAIAATNAKYLSTARGATDDTTNAVLVAFSLDTRTRRSTALRATAASTGRSDASATPTPANASAKSASPGPSATAARTSGSIYRATDVTVSCERKGMKIATFPRSASLSIERDAARAHERAGEPGRASGPHRKSRVRFDC